MKFQASVRLIGTKAQPIAYRGSDRQQSRMLVITFRDFELSLDRLKRLEQWLAVDLGLRRSDPGSTDRLSGSAQITVGFLNALLRLGMGLRQWSMNPAFEPGRVVLVRRARLGGQVAAKLAVPAGMGMTDEALERLYRSAATLCFARALRAQRDHRPTDLLTAIQKLIEDLRGFPGMVTRTTYQVLAAASRLDIPFMHVGNNVFQIGWGANSMLSDRSITAQDAAVGALITQDKRLTAVVLGRAGLPVPFHRLVGSLDKAIEAARAIGYPVVVKPANRDRGEGVTTDIADEDALGRAFGDAAVFSKRVLVERQVPGVCHRIFIARGEVLYVVRRDPKSVIGDGVRSVASLIVAANAREAEKLPWTREEPYPMDALTEHTLESQGLKLQSVPARGLRVSLRPIESTLWGGHDEDLTASIHPENAQVAIQAAKMVGLSNAGVDLISADISRPWHQNGAVINEVNFSPVLGVASISRSYLPEFLARHIRGDGRIPVFACVGHEDAERAAHAHHQSLCADGLNACLVGQSGTWVGEMPLSFRPGLGSIDRLRACLFRRDIDAVTIVVEDASLLTRGLPVDRLTTLPNEGTEGCATIEALKAVA
jgi:cyanophycin synthetase